MDSICIQGGIALQGKVRIQGSKNASLPVLAATLLADGRSFIRNCPRIADVYAMAGLLADLGCEVSWQEQGILVDSSGVRKGALAADAVKGMRSSLCLLGAVIGRCGEVAMEYPGGCVIGKRPIDLHLKALQSMGAEFEEERGRLHARAEKLHGSEIFFPLKSVGATENVILAGVMAEGDTILHGAAAEPEVTALCRYLKQCGAHIEGEGTDCIFIRGGARLSGTDFRVDADRIVAGTYLLGCIGIGGAVFLEGAPGDQMEAVTAQALNFGAVVCTTDEGIYVQAPKTPRLFGKLKTDVYPGFPTDLQSAALAAATVGEGELLIEETVFENRFRIVGELKKLGADVELLDERRAKVRGVSSLFGAHVRAEELRGGAALVIAGLMARGETVVSGCSYIYRGYENICRDLKELGARVISV